MLRFLFLTLVFFWIGRLVIRVLRLGQNRPRTTGRRPQSAPRPNENKSPARDDLRDLTQQEISDAEFEEIPSEEE